MVCVVILFLQTWRAAIIPVVAIPVSLIGCFLVMGCVGISFNTLSLFGLVLAIGIVVDDAIVVVENVERYHRTGHVARATRRTRTMDEVGGALIAIALVLCAVFIPTAFITGLQGSFYRQFAITIAAATVDFRVRLADIVSGAGGAAAEATRARAASVLLLLSSGRAGALHSSRGSTGCSSDCRPATAGWSARLVRVGVIVLVAYAGLIYWPMTDWPRRRPGSSRSSTAAI